MQPPEGLDYPSNMVCKLNKLLYGLKQASRQWFSKLHVELIKLGFSQSKQDYSLFIHKFTNHITIVAIYVDDILITGDDTSTIHKLKDHLHSTFNLKDLGILNYFLGIEVTHLPTGIVLTQRKFAHDLLKDSDISTFKSVVTPLPLHTKLYNDLPPYPNPTLYRSLVGKFNFLTNTRPDLSFSVQTLSQFMQKPSQLHYQLCSILLTMSILRSIRVFFSKPLILLPCKPSLIRIGPHVSTQESL